MKHTDLINYSISVLDLKTSKVKELGIGKLPAHISKEDEISFNGSRYIVSSIMHTLATTLEETLSGSTEPATSKRILLTDLRQLIELRVGTILEPGTTVENLDDLKPGKMSAIPDDGE